MSEVSFSVPGVPQPGGSKRFVGMSSYGKPKIIDANPKAREWKDAVAICARAAMRGKSPFPKETPLYLKAYFYMPRGKTVRRDSHTVKPDALKLGRLVEDALSGIVYSDDSQIVDEHLYKRYGNTPCVEIVVGEFQPES